MNQEEIIKQLQSDLSDLEEVHETLQGEVKRGDYWRDKCKEDRDEIARLTAERDQMRADYNNELQEMSERFRAVNLAECAKLYDKDMQTEITRLNKAVFAWQDEYDSVRTECEKANAEIARLTADLERSQAFRVEAEKCFIKARAEIARLTAERDEARRQTIFWEEREYKALTELKAEIVRTDCLQGEVDEAKAEIARLQSALLEARAVVEDNDVLLVPIKPTPDMIEYGGKGIARDTQHFGAAMKLARYSSADIEQANRDRALAAWKQMIAFRPGWELRQIETPDTGE